MDFKHTFEIITHSFEKENLKYAIIGGFALEAAGVIRATMDIDLLILANDKNIIKPIMLSNGYELIFELFDKLDDYNKLIDDMKNAD